MLVSPRVLLQDAEARKYAVSAFNFYNLDTLSAIIRAAEAEKAPMIAQIYSVHFTHYHGGGCIAAAALELIHASPMPIALHLDHSASYAYVLEAMRHGFNSVMIDGSTLPLDENIALTAKVTEVARHLHIYTEAELGRIVRNGPGNSSETDTADYTNVEDARLLVEETGVDSLAPAIGTAHGLYHKEPNIQFDLLRALREATGVPLVLHGGSGIPDEMIRKSIDCGVRKVNVGTELKYTWGDAVRRSLESGEKEIIAISQAAIDAVQEVARRKISLFGSSGRAEGILQQMVESVC